MMSASRRFFEVAGFRVDESRRLLFRGNEAIPLTSKVFDTLLILIRNRGRVLSKEELMQLLWPGTHVEEGNLALNISVLRKALEDSPNAHRFIVTIPGRGYQFIADVREDPGPEVSLPGVENGAPIVAGQEPEIANPATDLEPAGP